MNMSDEEKLGNNKLGDTKSFVAKAKMSLHKDDNRCFRQFRKIEKGEYFVVGVDTGAGGLDYCAAQFFSTDKLDVPLVYHERVVASEMTPKLHKAFEYIHDITDYPPMVAYERNNGGVYEMERLASLNRNNKYSIFEHETNFGSISQNTPSRYLGWRTDMATRPKMLTDLKEAIDKKIIRIYDRKTIKEMFSFVVVQTSTAWKAQAERGSHDDLMMALAISLQLYTLCPKPIKTMNTNIKHFNAHHRKKWSM